MTHLMIPRTTMPKKTKKIAHLFFYNPRIDYIGHWFYTEGKFTYELIGGISHTDLRWSPITIKSDVPSIEDRLKKFKGILEVIEVIYE